MSFRALLFDMDGVVIDTHQSVTTFWLDLAQQYQVTLTDDDFAKHIYGCPLNQTLDICFPKLTADERKAIHRHMVDYESNLAYDEVPGVSALLRALRQAGFPVALVTSGEPHKVEAVLSQLNIENVFSTIVTAVDIQHGKPDPEGYLLAAKRLAQAPENCVVFEDSTAGITAGYSAGAFCVGLDSWGNRAALQRAGAAHIIPNFADVRLERNGKDNLTLQLDNTKMLNLIL
ncbi:MAG: HAD family phosphatase [Anaerolineae bacterium]